MVWYSESTMYPLTLSRMYGLGDFGGFGSLVSILSLVLLVWALVDILRSSRDGMWKLIWVIVCLLLPLIGPILYYFIGRGSRL
jgi:phospholipase D-like protein